MIHEHVKNSKTFSSMWVFKNLFWLVFLQRSNVVKIKFKNVTSLSPRDVKAVTAWQLAHICFSLKLCKYILCKRIYLKFMWNSAEKH